MPKYRDIYIEDGKALANSGVYTVEIETADPISELWVNFGAVNGATSNKNSPIPRVISKIEIVDGANVIYSLDGELAHMLYYYQTGQLAENSMVEAENLSQYASFPIRFGRWLWDEVFALIPAKFRNLQLKITWDLAAVNAIGATGFLTGSAQLWVIARVMEGLSAAPAAYIMSKNHMNFVTAASGDERVDLPSDYPYALLMLRAYEAGVDMGDSITNAKLSLDHDKDVPFDIHMGDWMSLLRQEYGIIESRIYSEGATAVAREDWIGSEDGADIEVISPNCVGGVATLTSGQLTPRYSDYAGIAIVGDVQSFLRIYGVCMFNTIAHKFGNYEDEASYLNAPGYGDIKLILTQGNAGATVDVVLSQLRSYAV